MGDRYTITDRLDQGGMAEVFRGVAESIQGFKKSVAIKRVLPSLSKNQKFISMFLDEARLSLYLQHANIVQVFDIAKVDHSFFLVMEFVNGCNLKKLIERLKQRSRRIEVASAIYIAIECCKGLHYAHHLENPENGEPLLIVHRDISPPNILLSRMGEVKLVDFGLAKANSQIETTDPGVVKGKFSYLSPEAASGREVDHRADIFAVGIILWEMFTGRRLFYGDSDYQTVELVRQARIPSIGALNPGVDAELEGIVRQALARDPDERFSSAADLADALAQYLFSHRMKVTARDLSSLVRDTMAEELRSRPVKESSIIDALINEEVARLTSLVPEGSPAAAGGKLAEGSVSLDPSSFIDTSAWASDFGFARPASVSGAELVMPEPPVTHEPSNVAPLQHLLEPDRTGLHKRGESRAVLVALLIAVVLAGSIGLTLLLFKDQLFGAAPAEVVEPR